jgi:tRNA threonylcarbamoyladenosine biosynthesis protein TsaB
MKVLGIDTSGKFLSIGIGDGPGLYEYNLELAKKHSSLLSVTLKRILDALGWEAGDIDYFACGAGPGSFTGTRIGMAAMKGLAWALKKPVVAISSLDILAQNAFSSGCKEGSAVAVLVDAKRELIYAGMYKNKNGILKRSAPYRLSSVNELCKKIRPGTVLLGDALSVYAKPLSAGIKKAVCLDKDHWYPQGRYIVQLALERIRERKVSDAFDCKPVYLYPKECQVKKR